MFFLGIAELKVWLVGVPCLLFPILMLVGLKKPLGDVFLDLTLGDVCGVLGMS